MAACLSRFRLAIDPGRYRRLLGVISQTFADHKKPPRSPPTPPSTPPSPLSPPPKPPPASAPPPQDKQKKPSKTVADIKALLSEMMNSPAGFKKRSQERAALYKLLPSSQDELPTRTMADSYDECLVPLSTQVKLQNRYATVEGYVRIGRILEDTDMFAVWLCLKFIKNPKSDHSKVSPYTIVTIRVDDISFQADRPQVWHDLRLSGHVVWSGKTSMEVRILVDFFEDDEWRPFTKAYFVMAARNAATNKGAFVNKLEFKTPFEKEQYERALMRKKRRAADTLSLFDDPPHTAEQNMIFERYMKSLDRDSFSANLTKRILPQRTVWISDTMRHSELHPHPEYRNHQNTFFGGTLMRLANELAWLTAFSFSNERPNLSYISKVEFRVPVVLDSFLKFTALVSYTDERLISVVVACESTAFFSMETKVTNFFHFIFLMSRAQKQVMPSTYMEALLHIQAIRYCDYYHKEFTSE